ncbi:MAG: aminoacyl-histidine dipeptidase [Lachnospiraceae bacterium]|nr:aminoacyl-histidine dipeptidase [Lachnospiraceae bacterium]
MAVLEQLAPKKVFQFFEEICGIPHGSGNVEKISNYLVRFAEERGLTYFQDDLYNVVIIKEASEGYEEQEPLILQGHMDMVAVKKPGADIDMKTEGLRIAVEGDYVYAKDTSLGGDDGIAVAYALAVLDDDTIRHPRLEVVLTVDEEVGMEGASGIDLSMLKGHQMLNLDSEEEGIFLTSCAGGGRVRSTLLVSYEQKTGQVYHVVIGGLLGGHSGGEIHKERANSNILMGRLLQRVNGVAALMELFGGLADNAIPRETTAGFVVAVDQEAVFEAQVRELEQEVKKEFAVKDSGIFIKLEKEGTMENSVPALTAESMQKASDLLFLQPNGVQAMSADIHGLVQTSLNLGILELKGKELKLETSVRSSLQSEKDVLVQKLMTVSRLCGAQAEVGGEYPAWEYKKDSVLRERMVQVYRELYGREPEIQAIHAGLECGLLAGKIPDLDCVSIGPDMKDIHTTEEKLSISSVERVWELVLKVLEWKE